MWNEKSTYALHAEKLMPRGGIELATSRQLWMCPASELPWAQIANDYSNDMPVYSDLCKEGER